MFTQNDLNQFSNKGIDIKKIEKQIENFINGFEFLDIKKAAVKNDGLISLDSNKVNEIISKYENNIKGKKIVKFVPASGAASRMFKLLFSFMNSYDNSETKFEKLTKDKSFNSVYNFIKNIKLFAFFDLLQQSIGGEDELNEMLNNKDYNTLISKLLNAEGLDYGKLPKGLLEFHKYDEYSRTPVEEHLVEGANYCSSDNNVYVHFTVSPEYLNTFKKHIKDVKHIYEKQYNVTYNIDYSIQKASSDTIAVDLENKAFRHNNGSILFRPGGHGALIENLNDIDADYIFVKNIDNVVPDKIKDETYRYKKVLGGILFEYQNKIFEYLKQLNKSEGIEDKTIEEVNEFLINKICVLPTKDFSSKTNNEKVDYLISKLNRPIRVCGMVKNEGEPGGGPFWALNNDNTVSLQIVESSQIDSNNAEKNEIVKKASHFNPVDIFCSLKNYKGNLFNLLDFVDYNTGFISEKSKDGKKLKALELPGLWNGAMSDWNTIFVEVPIITFNPVKTVNDLLRNEHQ